MQIERRVNYSPLGHTADRLLPPAMQTFIPYNAPLTKQCSFSADEPVAKFGLEQLAGFNWNRWLAWNGITGKVSPEYALFNATQADLKSIKGIGPKTIAVLFEVLGK